MKKILLALFLSLFTSSIFAQSVGETLEFAWDQAVTGCVDFSVPSTCGTLPVADAVSGLQVFVSVNPITDLDTPTFIIAQPLVQATYDVTVPNGTTVYIRLRSVNRNGVSPLSVQLSKVVSVGLLPNAPTNLRFTVVP